MKSCKEVFSACMIFPLEDLFRTAEYVRIRMATVFTGMRND